VVLGFCVLLFGRVYPY